MLQIPRHGFQNSSRQSALVWDIFTWTAVLPHLSVRLSSANPSFTGFISHSIRSRLRLCESSPRFVSDHALPGNHRAAGTGRRFAAPHRWSDGIVRIRWTRTGNGRVAATRTSTVHNCDITSFHMEQLEQQRLRFCNQLHRPDDLTPVKLCRQSQTSPVR